VNLQETNGARPPESHAAPRYPATKHAIFAATQIIFDESDEDLAASSFERHRQAVNSFRSPATPTIQNQFPEIGFVPSKSENPASRRRPNIRRPPWRTPPAPTQVGSSGAVTRALSNPAVPDPSPPASARKPTARTNPIVAGFKRQLILNEE
jgi:hypothetical protein